MLGRDERDAVLGDLIEAGEGAWRATLAVVGLVLRREALLWKRGRPWIAALGLSLPCSFLLMGASLSVSRAFQDIAASSPLAGHASGCMFCLIRFRIESLSPFCLFLFVLPAAWGASHGLRICRMKRASAILLALAVTLLAVPTLHIHGGPWWSPPRFLIAMALTWPAWYLAATSKTRQPSDTRKLERCTNGAET